MLRFTVLEKRSPVSGKSTITISARYLVLYRRKMPLESTKNYEKKKRTNGVILRFVRHCNTLLANCMSIRNAQVAGPNPAISSSINPHPVAGFPAGLAGFAASGASGKKVGPPFTPEKSGEIRLLVAYISETFEYKY